MKTTTADIQSLIDEIDEDARTTIRLEDEHCWPLLLWIDSAAVDKTMANLAERMTEDAKTVRAIATQMDNLRLQLHDFYMKCPKEWLLPFPITREDSAAPSLADLDRILQAMGSIPQEPLPPNRGAPQAEWHFWARKISKEVEKLLPRLGCPDNRPATNPASASAWVAARAVSANRGVQTSTELLSISLKKRDRRRRRPNRRVILPSNVLHFRRPK